MTPKAFAVLRCQVAHAGHLVTKAMLMDTVWPETAISETTLTGCIWEVRQALGDSARPPTTWRRCMAGAIALLAR